MLHHLTCVDAGRRYCATYYGGFDLPLFFARRGQRACCVEGLPLYEQLDRFSCGFVAALSLVEGLGLPFTHEDVLRAVRPVYGVGTTADELVGALRTLGVACQFWPEADVNDLVCNLEQGAPAVPLLWSPRRGHWSIAAAAGGGCLWLVNDPWFWLGGRSYHSVRLYGAVML